MTHRPTRISGTGAAALMVGVLLPGLTACSAGIEFTEGTKSPQSTTSADSTRPALSPGTYFDSTCRDGEDVNVTEDDSTLHLDGQCGTVTVTASHAYIELQDVGATTIVGDGNTIHIGTLEQLTVQGSDNYIGFATVTGALVDEGVDNQIDQVAVESKQP